MNINTLQQTVISTLQEVIFWFSLFFLNQPCIRPFKIRERLPYFLPPHAEQDFFFHLLAGCARSRPLDAICPEMLPEPPAWQALHEAAHREGAERRLGTAAPTQLRFSDSAQRSQRNPAPQTQFPPSASSFPCTSGWTCPPTRNWATSTSPRITASHCRPQSTAFPLTDSEGLWLPTGQWTCSCACRMWKNKTM